MDTTVAVTVGGLTRPQLRQALNQAGVATNPFADLLLDRPDLEMAPTLLTVAFMSLADLGLTAGAPLPVVYDTALHQGLAWCPLATGPYLRLQHREAESDDPELRRHRPPDAALHIASAPVDPSHEYPKGFYLRTVEGIRWLRGYRCDDEYILTPESTFVFACP